MMRIHTKAAVIGFALSLAALGGAITVCHAEPVNKTSAKPTVMGGKMIIRKVPG